MGLLRKLFGVSRDRYQLDALVSSRTIDSVWDTDKSTHVICDLDKTYVETEFESWVKMARIPFERPHEKITVPGASEVLQALRWSHYPDQESVNQPIRPRAGLHFVSSSPPQLRSALEGKLMLDNLDWTSDTFKNQSYNLRMARIDLLRHHIAYKTKAILDVVATTPDGSNIWMIGDNAEYDPFVYEGIRLLLDGTIDVGVLGQWMAAAKVEKRVLAQVLHGHESLSRKKLKVAGVLIRKLGGYPVIAVPNYSDSVMLFDHWFQIAWLWILRGLINPKDLMGLVRSFHNNHGIPLAHFKACFDEVKQTQLDLPEDLKMQLIALNVLFETHGVKAHDSLSWRLRLSSPDLACNKTGSPCDYASVAKTWYDGIEMARILRKDR